MAHSSILIIIALIFSTQLIFGLESELEEEKEKCVEFCPKIFDPVCAYNGTKYFVYSNKCVFEAAQCKARNEGLPVLMIRPLPFCRRGIDLPDPRVVKLTLDGSVSEKSERCSEVCITLYDPVCALLEGKYVTYSNSCFLGIAECNARKNGDPVPVGVEKTLCLD